MANIYISSTLQPSKLYRNLLTDKLFILENSVMDVSECNREYQYVYITSDEEIKEGDCFISLYSNSIQRELTLDWTLNKDAYKKIILTTDKDLIKDGVQVIDDEFLEWFVKNPSCEEVEVVEGDMINGEYTFGKYHIGRMYYTDEPKQRLEKYTERFDNKENELVKGIGNPNTWGKRLVEEPKQELERGITITHVGKQETLEESYLNQLIDEISRGFVLDKKSVKEVATKFANWQQKRSYSAEEVLSLLFKYGYNLLDKDAPITGNTTEEWFEQFKKK